MEVTTIAGTPTIRGNKDGTAHQSQFDRPLGISIDISGNIFLAQSNGRIRRVSKDGIVSTIVKKGTLRCPYSVRVENSKNLLIADTWNHVIRRVSTDGRDVSMVAGILGRQRRYGWTIRSGNIQLSSRYLFR